MTFKDDYGNSRKHEEAYSIHQTFHIFREPIRFDPGKSCARGLRLLNASLLREHLQSMFPTNALKYITRDHGARKFQETHIAEMTEHMAKENARSTERKSISQYGWVRAPTWEREDSRPWKVFVPDPILHHCCHKTKLSDWITVLLIAQKCKFLKVSPVEKYSQFWKREWNEIRLTSRWHVNRCAWCPWISKCTRSYLFFIVISKSNIR